jgi:hypothetical protein
MRLLDVRDTPGTAKVKGRPVLLTFLLLSVPLLLLIPETAWRHVILPIAYVFGIVLAVFGISLYMAWRRDSRRHAFPVSRVRATYFMLIGPCLIGITSAYALGRYVWSLAR